MGRTKPKFATQSLTKIQSNKFAPSDAGFHKRNPEFSFTHYQHDHKEYSSVCIIDCGDFHTMFDRLKRMSQLTWQEIINASHMYHFHPIEWNKTSERHGFKLAPKELNEAPAWQFKSFRECRIIGFFNSKNIFELVWIDRDHQVYPQK